MRFLRQSVAGLFWAAVTLGLIVYAVQMVGNAVQTRMADSSSPPRNAERVYVVNTVTAETGSEKPVLETFGEIASRRTLELRAAVSGRVVALSPGFEEGGAVSVGETLVSIDSADSQAVFDRATSDLADARAEVRDAARGLDLAREEVIAAEDQATLRERAFSRQRDLSSRGVGTSAAQEDAELAAAAARAVVLARRQAVAAAEARVDQASTRLARAGIALDEAERDLADTKLTAPFTGIISDRNVVEGGLVGVNERLAELVDPEDLEVSFRVSTAQYSRLIDDTGALISAPVTVSLDVTGVDIIATGTLSRVSAAAGEGQTGRLVYARLTQSAGFRPGDFVTVNVEEPQIDNVVRLPASALDGDARVLALGEGDRLEAIPVTLVRRQGNDVLVRAEGLDGREVVRETSPLLGPGIAVRPTRPDGDTDGDGAPAQNAMMELTDARRAELVAFVEKNQRMPAEAKARVLAQLAAPQVPAEVVRRIESRMGG